MKKFSKTFSIKNSKSVRKSWIFDKFELLKSVHAVNMDDITKLKSVIIILIKNIVNIISSYALLRISHILVCFS